jgi:hypothetical protein
MEIEQSLENIKFPTVIRKEEEYMSVAFPIESMKIHSLHKTSKGELMIIKMRVAFTNGVVEPMTFEMWPRSITHLAHFLGVTGPQLKDMVAKNQMDVINQLIKEAEVEVLKLDARTYLSNWDNSYHWSIFNVASLKHVAVPFRAIENIIKEVAQGEPVFARLNKQVSWTRKFHNFDLDNEPAFLYLHVLSGTNVKTSAIKVMLKIQVTSCVNSIQCATYQPIKHTLNWEARLRGALTTAMSLANRITGIYQEAVRIPMTLEEALQWVDEEVHLQIRTEEKVEKIKKLLKRRLRQEFNSRQNRFALSQALSYVATHEQDEAFTEYSREQLAQYAHAVIAQ